MTFDDGYDRGDVVRLFFGHNAGGTTAAPFAYRDVAVTADDGDAIVGYRADAQDDTLGSLRDDAPDDRTPVVRIKRDPCTVRKSAVVMKRGFGNVAAGVHVTKDESNEFGADDVTDTNVE
jgi:hypothetical protein